MWHVSCVMREHLFVNILKLICAIKRKGNNYELREASLSDAVRNVCFNNCVLPFFFAVVWLLFLLTQSIKSMNKESSADF